MMNKKPGEKVKDFFIQMGKQHRLLLPIAVLGLAITMLILKVIDYCKHGTKRFACVLFIACLFLIGNSFAFPNLYFNNGFVSNEESVDNVVAEESSIALDNNAGETAVSAEIYEDESEEMIDSENIDTIGSEYGEVSENEIISLDEILDTVEVKDEKDRADQIGIVNAETNNFQRDDWRLMLINKQHPIPEDYELSLGTLMGSYRCDERIIDDLLMMLKAAQNDGVSLRICSLYRDAEHQKMLFERKVKAYMKMGYSYIDAFKISSQAVTIPGASEHQVGLAIDFITNNYTTLDEGFENTTAGKWLKDNCAKYGFVLRYPKGKEYITSIEYEPWHFRYVGPEAATVMMSESLCLEEFWDKYL